MALAYFNRFTRRSAIAPFEQVLILAYLSGFFALLIYVLLFRLTLPLLQPLSRLAKVAWCMLALAVGAVAVSVAPSLLPQPLTPHRLEIVATGRKNPASNGSEVWV